MKGNQDAWVGNQDGVEQAEMRKNKRRRTNVEERNMIKPIFPLRNNLINYTPKIWKNQISNLYF